MKKALKAALYFALYLVLAYAAMLPGYGCAQYWMLFPVAAAFLMSGPLTCAMGMIRRPGSALLLPLLFFLAAKLIGELKFAVCWVPYLVIIVLAEILRDATGADKLRSIRLAVPAALVSIAMWNNGFYFGGEAYRAAAVADMGETYIAAAYGMCTPVTYIAVLAGVIVTAAIGERLTEKIAKIA